MRPTRALAALLALALLAACHAPANANGDEAAAPFDWPLPAGWRQETIAFPLEFAPSLAFRGREEVRFLPGFFDDKARTYWSYAFSWWLDEWLEDAPPLDARAIGDALTTYYRGLSLAVGKDRFAFAAERFAAEFAAATDGTAAFVGTVRSYDAFTTGQPIELHVEVQQLAGRAGRRALTFLVSPQPRTDVVWSELRACAAALRRR